MTSVGYRRFVAIFVGILLVLGIVSAVVTGDEGLVGMCAALGAFYAFYMFLFIRKEKELRAENPKQKKSPLIKR